MKTNNISPKATVLYVDDDIENLQGFKALFRRNYTVHLADSAKAAIDILKNETIEVLITDQRMPEMTGSELLEAVADKYPHMLRFILTGFSDFDPLVRALNEGRLQGFFTKPLNVDQIRNRIEEGLERYYLEKQNQKLNASLREMEIKLYQAQKMEALGTLASGIAHDFNNILSPLLGYTEMLKMDLPQESPHQSMVGHILDATMRAKALTHQILSFSHQKEEEKRPVKLEYVIKEVKTLLDASIPTTIDILVEIAPQCGMVLADPTQIHQIVMNLATNAYHAMEETGGKLKISLGQVRIETIQPILSDLVPGQYALMKVIDTGSGIAKPILNKIFDPYFTTKKKGKGTGLGLSIVQGIVKGYKGDIHVYSEPGQGTEIHVYLPILESTPIDLKDAQTESIQSGSEHILLVDDEPTIVDMTKAILERLGYRVTPLTCSIEALNTFRSDPKQFDLIISDMTMPHMTGLQLAGKIKSICPDMPIIICTGFSDQISESFIKEIGIQGYIVKPILIKQMASAIRKALD